MSLLKNLSLSIADAIKTLYGIEPEEKLLQLQKTKKEFRGHYTLVVFPFLKASKKSPEATAEEIGKYLLEKKADLIKDIEVVKGFLNLEIDSRAWINELNDIANTENYGHKVADENSPLVMVEYSSPNTNKPLHLGHIRNNLLGYSISQILKAAGNKVVKTNIVNDRGIHISKSMLAWKKWGEGATPESTNKKGDHLVGDFYVLFDKHYKAELNELMAKGLSKGDAEKESKIMQEAREMLRAWEQGDKEIYALWEMMNNWVYDGFDTTYKRLGVDFDKIYYESQTYIVGKEEVLRGLDAGVLQRDADSSVWADLSDVGLDRKLLLRQDGTSVYMTQDIGTAKTRYQDYDIDKMVYVVGNEQNYHFQVLSIILDRLGFKFGKDLKHFSYGMVELPEGKMKSREGTVVDADDLMDEMENTAYEISKEQGKTADLSEEEAREIARKVGLASLKYFILKVDPKKNMTFNPKESIDFNGNTGAFILYTYARIRSLLRKAEEQNFDIPQTINTDTLSEIAEKEQALIQNISNYTDVVSEAANAYSPALIANYVYDLVKEYNQFYHDFSVLREEDESKRSFRLSLSKVVADTIEKAFALLGIEMTERM